MAEVIAERILTIAEGDKKTPVPVRIHAPRREIDEHGQHWECDFNIGWPDEPLRRYAAGHDAVQALELAMRMIGANLYASEAHERGQLLWDEPGQGYGFPVPNNIRDVLVGNDAVYL